MENLGILVGKGFDFKFGGQEKILSELRSRGYYAIPVDEPWPRNNHVYFNDKYTFEQEKDCSNAFGNGGMVLKGDNFLMVSDGAFLYDNFKLEVDVNKLKINRAYYESSKEKIINEGKKKFKCNVHVAPTGNFFDSKGSNIDIDLFTLVIPKNKLLIFDSFFGGEANKYLDYNKIAEKEGFEFIEYDGKKDGVWYPLNSLVLHNNKEQVFLDKNSKSLVSLLQKHGIECIGIDMPQRHQPAGKIHCQTNVFNIKDKDKIMRVF